MGVRTLLACAMVLSLLAVAVLPSGVRAQQGMPWDSHQHDRYSVLVQSTSRTTATQFSAQHEPAILGALEELELLLDAPPLTRPVTIYLYDDVEQYRAAIAATGRVELEGIIAFAHPPSHAVFVPLARFQSLTDDDARRALRHALAHIAVGEASGHQIPRGFDEGFARYFEVPSQPELARLASTVQLAHREGRLISWSNLNRAQPLDDDAVIEAQAYAVVGYLIKHHGLDRFRSFLTLLQDAPSWREAIRDAYAPTTADALERQWRDDIPLWAQGDWKWNIVAGFDLEPAQDLLARGNFQAASSTLLVSEQLLTAVDDPERAALVSALKDQARIGSLAESKMVEAQKSLELFEYDRAAVAVAQADEHYANLPPSLRPQEIIAEYQRLAQMGLRATEQFELARIRSGAWGDYPEARRAAIEAGTAFQALGDDDRWSDARALVSHMDGQQLRLVSLLAALALLTLVWLALWLRYREPRRLRWR